MLDCSDMVLVGVSQSGPKGKQKAGRVILL